MDAGWVTVMNQIPPTRPRRSVPSGWLAILLAALGGLAISCKSKDYLEGTLTLQYETFGISGITDQGIMVKEHFLLSTDEGTYELEFPGPVASIPCPNGKAQSDKDLKVSGQTIRLSSGGRYRVKGLPSGDGGPRQLAVSHLECLKAGGGGVTVGQ